MKKNLVLLLALFAMSFSQRLSHPLRLGEPAVRQASGVNDTLNILAIMVQFQEDNSELTTGNGKFNLQTAAEPIIDAPPHDSTYFADHFVFARNYFAKASNGKQHVTATVLGDTITLPKQMREYAPLNGNLPLAQMIEEAWKKADELYPAFPFQDYDLFVLFHAGVGKDIDLRGSLGYDPSPYDLPSLYFNLSAFRNLFGDSFSGIPIQNSAFLIQNSIVLPSTEVRKIPGIGGDITLKFGINGLLVASIASHLGLPDLFDTKTGRTAIGRFGLMDGQAIFSFAGICPPEPSAWEKAYLGWTAPIEIYGDQTLSVPAAGLHQTGNDTVYRIPISAKEYFLVENRQRDAKGDNQTVTMKWKGNIITKTFAKDEERVFSNTEIDSVYGVVLDVDELDWSLPGLVNDNNNHKGGVLIWHIDETVIEKNLASNSINADPLMRGVDVEEADGSQDIGKSYDPFTSPGSGTEDGWSLDYWFSGNIFPLYENKFSETTHPNSLSNSSARSHITVKNFSASSPRMTFEANVGDAAMQLVKVIQRGSLKLNNDDAPFTADLDGDGTEELIYTSGDSIFALTNTLTPYLNNTTGLFAPFGGRFQPAFFQSLNTGNLIPRGLIAIADSSIYFFNPPRSDSVANADDVINVGDVITTPATVRSSTPLDLFIVGTRGGKYLVADTAARTIQTFSSPIISISSSFAATIDSVSIGPVKLNVNAPIVSVGAATFAQRSIAILQTVSSITMVDNNTYQQAGQFNLPDQTTSPMLLTDLDSDRSPDIVIGIGNKVYAFNINGSIADNFPFSVDAGDAVVGSVVANNKLLVFGTKKGLLYAINGKGQIVDGFPLQTGGMVSAPFVGSNYLVSASTDTSIYVWKYANQFDPADRRWQTYLGTIGHNTDYINFASPNQKSSELLPKKFAYNWPNPTYGGTTNIRYFLGKSAAVKIKIVNLAGELVDELQGTSYAGLDNEVQWDVSEIQSGIYFAQITASGSGEEQSQIIKIAVVK